MPLTTLRTLWPRFRVHAPRLLSTCTRLAVALDGTRVAVHGVGERAAVEVLGSRVAPGTRAVRGAHRREHVGVLESDQRRSRVRHPHDDLALGRPLERIGCGHPHHLEVQVHDQPVCHGLETPDGDCLSGRPRVCSNPRADRVRQPESSALTAGSVRRDRTREIQSWPKPPPRGWPNCSTAARWSTRTAIPDR